MIDNYCRCCGNLAIKGNAGYCQRCFKYKRVYLGQLNWEYTNLNLYCKRLSRRCLEQKYIIKKLRDKIVKVRGLKKKNGNKIVHHLHERNRIRGVQQ